jgi:hypothetical protein
VRVLHGWGARNAGPLVKLSTRLPGGTLWSKPVKLLEQYVTPALRTNWDPRIEDVETLAHWRAQRPGGWHVQVFRTCTKSSLCGLVGAREFTQAAIYQQWRSGRAGTPAQQRAQGKSFLFAGTDVLGDGDAPVGGGRIRGKIVFHAMVVTPTEDGEGDFDVEYYMQSAVGGWCPQWMALRGRVGAIATFLDYVAVFDFDTTPLQEVDSGTDNEEDSRGSSLHALHLALGLVPIDDPTHPSAASDAAAESVKQISCMSLTRNKYPGYNFLPRFFKG